MKQISLLYHDVVTGSFQESGFEGASANIYKLSAGQFSQHLASFAELGPGSVSLVRGEHEALSRGLPLHLTFDDGGVSALNPTADLLEERGWRGHFFIVTKLIGKPGFLSATQICDLYRRGHHIGSHSDSHPPRFSKLTRVQMLREWCDSREALTTLLGVQVTSASVPGGYFSRDVAVTAREAGYSILFTSEPTANVYSMEGLEIYGRYGIQNTTPTSVAKALARGDSVPRVRQAVAWNLKKSLKRLGGGLWLDFRDWYFMRSRKKGPNSD